MAKKISELTELTSVTGLDYTEVSKDDGGGGYVSKKWRPGTMSNQNANNVSITGGAISGITDLAVADGGTGASDAAGARTNMGLGSMATQAANNVAITGGAISGITDLAVADGGTGASDASGARTNLGLGSMATQAAGSVAITGGNITGITKSGFASEFSIGTITGATEVNWSSGNYQSVTLGDSVTLTFANMTVGKKQLRVIQDGTGSRIPTLPTGKWAGGAAGTFSTAADAIDILEIYYDGTNYYYTLTKGWA